MTRPNRIVVEGGVYRVYKRIRGAEWFGVDIAKPRSRRRTEELVRALERC